MNARLLTLWKVISCCILFVYTTMSHATPPAEYVEFSGRITDASGSVYFEGALVEITELKRRQVTKSDGSFRFRKLTPGRYTLRVSYLGLLSKTYEIDVRTNTTYDNLYQLARQQEHIDKLVIYGERAGYANALNLQKNAINLKTVVSSDVIGNFPDRNAAESLQRLPGVSIQRDQGEGRFANVRGIGPNLNQVKINDTSIPAPESGERGVALDVLPSELIESLEVSKTLTADMDADAVGGTINVKSLSGLDREQESYTVSAESGYNQLADKFNPKLSASYSNAYSLGQGRKLGLATAVSWRKRRFDSHNIESDGGWSNIEFEDPLTGATHQIFGAEEIEQRFYQITRERTGLAFNVGYHHTNNSQHHVKALYSKYTDEEFRLRNEYKFAKGQVDVSSLTERSAQFFDFPVDKDTKDRLEVQKILSVTVGGELQRDTWLWSYNVGYAKSSEDVPDRIQTNFEGQDFHAGYKSTGPIPQLSLTNDLHLPNNYALEEVSLESKYSEDEEQSVKLDLSKTIHWRDSEVRVKFGGKYRSRSKVSQVDVKTYDGGFNRISADAFSIPFNDWSLGQFGPALSQSEVRQFVRNNQTLFELNNNESRIESQGDSYNSDEDILASYGLLDVTVNKWRFNTGLRYESTSFSTTGNRIDFITDEVNDSEQVVISPWSVNKEYEHWLPNLNIRYNLDETLITRLAYTQTIARPKFSDSAAFQLIETERTQGNDQVSVERAATVGNPQLAPYESENLDISVEYYPGDISLLSAAIFFKNIDNVIIQSEVQNSAQWQGFEEVLQPTNGESAKLQGIELAWTNDFDFGLLIAANLTLIDANTELPNFADTTANITIGYSSDSINGRLSVSHKGKAFQFIDNGTSVYQDKHEQVDLNLKYYLNDYTQVYFNVINLTDEPYYLFHGQHQYNYQFESYGRTYELGVSLASF